MTGVSLTTGRRHRDEADDLEILGLLNENADLRERVSLLEGRVIVYQEMTRAALAMIRVAVATPADFKRGMWRTRAWMRAMARQLVDEIKHTTKSEAA